MDMTQLMDTPVKRPLWQGRRMLLAAAAAGVVIAVVFLGFALAGARTSLRTPATGVVVGTVEAGVFRDFVTLRAKVVPRDVVYLGLQEGGQVSEVLARSGDVVAAGQPLVKFRNTQLELEVLDREARLSESITQLQAYEKQLEDARAANEKAAAQIDYDVVRLERDARRLEALLAQGYVPRQKYEDVRDQLTLSRQLQPLQITTNRTQDALRRRQLPQLQSDLATLQTSLKVVRTKLDSLTLRAPVAGKLADMHLNVGEIHDRGERLGQIVADSGYKIEARVDEYYLDRVRVGQAGQVEADGRAWPLRVTRVDPQVKDATFLVELAFAGAGPNGVAPGQALEGQITLGGDRPGLLLPAGAFLEKTGGAWAMVVGGDGEHADRRSIKIGRRNADQVEVLAGLKPGERVITSDYTGFEKVERVVLTK
ncbi:efflux RND transporter periplasmic adaptor subunit [uncultured Phenylobacterium sp.]|uniref:efflux RND transporter periplasmic adaptor subunit n=1 Tax=uncultured Phenylobacterium sp. TaxID=349273 RepID=UPI0025FA2846|nr:efflux RND transporter periplasmic adaptor subunit [uncultured Phenylobacterium sp.]